MFLLCFYMMPLYFWPELLGEERNHLRGGGWVTLGDWFWERAVSQEFASEYE